MPMHSKHESVRKIILKFLCQTIYRLNPIYHPERHSGQNPVPWVMPGFGGFCNQMLRMLSTRTGRLNHRSVALHNYKQHTPRQGALAGEAPRQGLMKWFKRLVIIERRDSPQQVATGHWWCWEIADSRFPFQEYRWPP